jgi:hypothetical protein
MRGLSRLDSAGCINWSTMLGPQKPDGDVRFQVGGRFISALERFELQAPAGSAADIGCHIEYVKTLWSEGLGPLADLTGTWGTFAFSPRGHALRDTEMSGEMVRALGGWSGGGSTSDDYGSGFTPERLYGAIQAVRYDGLGLSHLYLS